MARCMESTHLYSLRAAYRRDVQSNPLPGSSWYGWGLRRLAKEGARSFQGIRATCGRAFGVTCRIE